MLGLGLGLGLGLIPQIDGLGLGGCCCGYRVKPQHLASPRWHDWSVSTDGSRLLVTLNDREEVRLLLAA